MSPRHRPVLLPEMLLVVLGLLVASPPALAQAPYIYPEAASGFTGSPEPAAGGTSSAQETVEDGAICTTIDFEGVGDLAAIPEFDGITSPGWLGIIDLDAGGSGNIAFEPSPETVAFWLGGAPGARDILIADPASRVGFFYTSFVTVTLQAFDAAGNLLDSAVGGPNFDQGPGGDPNGTFNDWDPLEVESDENDIVRVRVSGNVNQTAIDDLKVCRALRIARIEVTQAIQEIQEIDDLEADLGGDREPPVPLIEGKPAVMRVYPDQVQAATTVEVEVEIAGVLVQSRRLRLQPQCDPDLRRRRDNGCRSLDFYFTPPGGDWTATVRLLTETGEEVESRELPLSSREADRLVLRSVSVCDARNPANGAWLCGRGATVAGLTDFLRRTAPTHRVEVSATNNFVRNDIAAYDANGNGVIDGPESTQWFIDTAAEVGDLFGLWDRLLGLFGQERYYYGMVRNAVPGGIGGIADGIPSRGAMSRESTVRLGVEVNFETLAHETGHMFGRRHTNTGVPAAAGAPPGCYNVAVDPGTDWPFADNTIQSANGPEVGFDVGARAPVLPENHFDWMSYCTPRWISPHTYTRSMPAVDADFQALTSGLTAEPSEVGRFWIVSGRIDAGAAVLEPLFEHEILGPTGPGSGPYAIEVRDAAGTVLAVRRFDVRVAETETLGGEVTGLPAFHELVPVQPAAVLAIIGPDGAEIGALAFGGAAPAVTITSPAPGELLTGVDALTWQIADADSSHHWSAVDYSLDGGDSWSRLGVVEGETALTVDFDLVSGSASPLLRVTATDGVNSGVASTADFTVGRKLPTVEIVGPAAGEVFAALDLVWLRANAFDPDDGFLDGAAVVWSSSLDGPLGSGAELTLTTLSAGLHEIAVDATDSDGNLASATVAIRVAGDPPDLTLDVTALDTLPTTCVLATIDAAAGSSAVGLAAVEYSLDGGQSWTPIAAGAPPFRFIVPGEGFFHLVARAFDEAGQVDADDERFFIDSPCQNQNQPPVADAGPDRTVTCTDPAGTPVILDGSGSFDPEGAALTYAWTGPFPEGGGTAGGVAPAVTLALGTSIVSLVVDDGQLVSAPDSVALTVALGVDGFRPPLAGLVPAGQTPPAPPRAFEQGRTLPLRLALDCGGSAVGAGEIGAPRIVALERDGIELELDGLDLDAGNSNGGGLEFRDAGDQWLFNLSTRDLEPGSYVITLELAAGQSVAGAFELR